MRVGTLIFTSYLMWQTAVILLVLNHAIAVRTLWRMTGRTVRAGLVGGWVCIGMLVMIGGRMSWQIRSELEVVSFPTQGQALELFAWSSAALVLSIILGRNLRLLFEHLQRQFGGGK